MQAPQTAVVAPTVGRKNLRNLFRPQRPIVDALRQKSAHIASHVPRTRVAALSIRGRIATMPRFSLKDLLRGMTLASIGFGMLAVAFSCQISQTSKEAKLVQAFLVAFGGM